MKKYSEQIAMCDNSEVFREFLKITKAYDNGLEDYDDKVKPDNNYKSKSEVKDIEELYGKGVPNEDETGNELIEKAHKDTVEMINSYLNGAGTVKNDAQNHKITVDVASKTPSMSNIHTKNVCAINDLTKELVIVAQEMDIRGESDLAAFADDMLERISETSDDVKKKLTVKQAQRYSRSGWGTAAKWILGLLGAGVLAYNVTKRVDNSKVYPIRIACRSLIKSIIDYKASHKDMLESEEMNSLDSVIKIITDYENQYYTRSDNFKLLYEQIIDTVSGSQNDNEVNLDELYKKLIELNGEVDMLSVKMQRPLQNALSNLQNVQQDMEQDGGKISGARTSWDAFRENSGIISDTLFGSDEQILIDNFNKLVSSIDADKLKRSKRITGLKNMIDTYKNKSTSTSQNNTDM